MQHNGSTDANGTVFDPSCRARNTFAIESFAVTPITATYTHDLPQLLSPGLCMPTVEIYGTHKLIRDSCEEKYCKYNNAAPDNRTACERSDTRHYEDTPQPNISTEFASKIKDVSCMVKITNTSGASVPEGQVGQRTTLIVKLSLPKARYRWLLENITTTCPVNATLPSFRSTTMANTTARTQSMGHSEQAAHEGLPVYFHDAPTIEAQLPPGVDISSQEILAFYPNHVQWPSVLMRLVNNGYTATNISDIANWHRTDGRVDRVTLESLIKYAGRSYYDDPRWSHIKHMIVPTKNISTKRLKCPLELSRESRAATLLCDLARSVTHWPIGLEARELTWAMHFAVKNPDLNLTVRDVKHIADGFFYKNRSNKKAPIKPVGPQNLDRVTLTSWAELGKLAENPRGNLLGSAWELLPGHRYPD